MFLLGSDIPSRLQQGPGAQNLDLVPSMFIFQYKKEQFFIQWNQWSFTIASIYRVFPKFNKCLYSKSQEAKYDALAYSNFWLR